MVEFVVEFGEYDGCSRNNEGELIDDKDRRLIDNALQASKWVGLFQSQNKNINASCCWRTLSIPKTRIFYD